MGCKKIESLVSNNVQSDRVMLLLQESQHLLAKTFPVFIDGALSETPRSLQPKKCVWQFQSEVEAVGETGASAERNMLQEKSNLKVGFTIRKNRLLWCLIVLVTIFLVAAIGMFVFLSLNAKYQFTCLLGCKQSEDPAAHEQISASVQMTAITAGTLDSLKTSSPEIRKGDKPTQKQAVSTDKSTTVIKIVRDTAIIRSRTPIIHFSTPSTSASTHSKSNKINANTAVTKFRPHGKSTTARRVTPPASTLNLRTTAKPRRQSRYINISGKISFRGKAPKRLPRNSRLIVELEDVSRMDAASILLAKTDVDLSQYRRGKPLYYTIIYKRSQLAHTFYGISAVLNLGWKPTDKDDWLRKGDFFNDMFLQVHIKNSRTLYERNIQLIKYKP